MPPKNEAKNLKAVRDKMREADNKQCADCTERVSAPSPGRPLAETLRIVILGPRFYDFLLWPHAMPPSLLPDALHTLRHPTMPSSCPTATPFSAASNAQACSTLALRRRLLFARIH